MARHLKPSTAIIYAERILSRLYVGSIGYTMGLVSLKWMLDINESCKAHNRRKRFDVPDITWSDVEKMSPVDFIELAMQVELNYPGLCLEKEKFVEITMKDNGLYWRLAVQELGRAKPFTLEDGHGAFVDAMDRALLKWHAFSFIQPQTARLMVKLAQPKVHDRVLEVSQIPGRLLNETLKHYEEIHEKPSSLHLIAENVFYAPIAHAAVVGFPDVVPEVTITNFLRNPPRENGRFRQYDVVLVSTRRAVFGDFDPFSDAFGRFRFGIPHRDNRTWLLVQAVWEHLAPGGRAVLRVPSGELWRPGETAWYATPARDVRKRIVEAGMIKAVVDADILGKFIVLEKTEPHEWIKMVDGRYFLYRRMTKKDWEEVIETIVNATIDDAWDDHRAHFVTKEEIIRKKGDLRPHVYMEVKS